MGDLQTNVDLLPGKKIERIHIVDSERVRQADKYLIVECEDGTRIILAHVENLPKPAPNSLMALREAAKEHGAFTVGEALILAEGKALGPAPNTQSHVKPDSVSVDDARGLTQIEEKVTEGIKDLWDARSREQADKLKDKITELIQMIPQESRGKWIGELGRAYKETFESIRQAKKRERAKETSNERGVRRHGTRTRSRGVGDGTDDQR